MEEIKKLIYDNYINIPPPLTQEQIDVQKSILGIDSFPEDYEYYIRNISSVLLMGFVEGKLQLTQNLDIVYVKKVEYCDTDEISIRNKLMSYNVNVCKKFKEKTDFIKEKIEFINSKVIPKPLTEANFLDEEWKSLHSSQFELEKCSTCNKPIHDCDYYYTNNCEYSLGTSGKSNHVTCKKEGVIMQRSFLFHDYEGSIGCDLCTKDFNDRDEWFSCRKCDYDLCLECKNNDSKKAKPVSVSENDLKRFKCDKLDCWDCRNDFPHFKFHNELKCVKCNDDLKLITYRTIKEHEVCTACGIGIIYEDDDENNPECYCNIEKINSSNVEKLEYIDKYTIFKNVKYIRINKNINYVTDETGSYLIEDDDTGSYFLILEGPYKGFVVTDCVDHYYNLKSPYTHYISFLDYMRTIIDFTNANYV